MIFKSTVVSITLLSFLISLAGCYMEREITRGDAKRGDPTISIIVTTKGDTISFIENMIEPRGARVKDSLLVGLKRTGDWVSIPLSEVDRIYERRVNGALTFLVITGVVIGSLAVLAWLAMKDKPFMDLDFH